MARPPALSVGAIGTVHTRHRDVEHTPVQSSLNRDDHGWIEIDPRSSDALDGLGEFSHVWLLTWLGGAVGPGDPPVLRQVPYLLQRAPRALGVLATRGPRRLNPIGLSLVELLAVEHTTIRFAGVDLVDGTPLLDLKPYVERFDRPVGEVRCGWFDTLSFDGPVTPAGLAPEDGDPGSGRNSRAMTIVRSLSSAAIERGEPNVSTVCQHLALVAVDGATDEVALTSSPGFLLHTGSVTTDRWGYLALIEANRCLSVARPPLDVLSAVSRGDFVSVSLVPSCLAHFRVVDGGIAELWLTRDWRTWREWRSRYDMA